MEEEKAVSSSKGQEVSPSRGILRDKEAREEMERLTLPHMENHLCSVERLDCDCVLRVVIIHELIFPLRDLGIGPFVSISKWIAGHNARNGNASSDGRIWGRRRGEGSVMCARERKGGLIAC